MIEKRASHTAPAIFVVVQLNERVVLLRALGRLTHTDHFIQTTDYKPTMHRHTSQFSLFLPPSLPLSLSLPPPSLHFFPGEPGLAGFIEAKDDSCGADNWNYKTCKAPVRSSPSTNQHPVFLQAGCLSYRPTNSVEALKGITRHSSTH